MFQTRARAGRVRRRPSAETFEVSERREIKKIAESKPVERGLPFSVNSAAASTART
jgi:hypothetical protein